MGVPSHRCLSHRDHHTSHGTSPYMGGGGFPSLKGNVPLHRDIPSHRKNTPSHGVSLTRGIPQGDISHGGASPHMSTSHMGYPSHLTEGTFPHTGGGDNIIGGCILRLGTLSHRGTSPHMWHRISWGRRNHLTWCVPSHRDIPSHGGGASHLMGGEITSRDVCPHTGTSVHTRGGASHLTGVGGKSPHTMCLSHRGTSPHMMCPPFIRGHPLTWGGYHISWGENHLARCVLSHRGTSPHMGGYHISRGRGRSPHTMRPHTGGPR